MVDKQYFENSDLDIFRWDLQSSSSKDIRDARKIAQSKLIALNPEIIRGIKSNKLDLYNHAQKNHITSLIFPCTYNKGHVNWIGIRYGKSERDIKELNKTVDRMSGFRNGNSSRYANNRSNDIKMQFQKHACLQIDISYDGVDVGIFHAVPYGAIDRIYLHDVIDKDDKSKINLIVQELKKIQFYGYKWHIYDTNAIDEVFLNRIFDFDLRQPEDFLSWYDKYDKDGCFSSMLMHFPRYDKRISENNIIDTCISIIKQLYPLYKAISWDISYKGKNKV